MRKSILFAAVAMTVTALAGCTGGSDGSTSKTSKVYKYKGLNVMDNQGPETGEISFQTGGGSTEMVLWDRLINDFENKNPGITVKKVNIADSDALLTQLNAGTAPDVIQCETHNFGDWTNKGALQAIQPFVEEENLDTSDFWPQALQIYSFNTQTGIRGNGDLFALPKDFGVNGIFVNKTLVDRAHNEGRLTETQYNLVTDKVNPMTYEEYIDIAVALTEYDGTANSIYGSNRIYWESYLWSFDDDILDENYKFNYQSENVKKVFNYSREMITEGDPHFCAPYSSSASSSSSDEMTMFNTGKIAMYWSGRWNVPSYDASNVMYYCIPTPVAVKEGGVRGECRGWCATIGYSIPRNCRKTRMAYKFIKYLSSPEAYRVMNELNYAVPGRKSLITEPGFADPKNNNGSRCLDAASAATFFRAAENARLANAARFTTQRWISAFEDKLELFFTHDYETIDEFLLDVRNDVNNALKASDPYLF